MIRVILTGILSLIFPGIGQVFNGQWIKGIALALAELSIIYFIIPSTWVLILFRVIWLYAIVDAIVVAVRAKNGISKPKGLMGGKAIIGVGMSLLLILPLAWFPSFLPDMIFSLAARSSEVIDEDVPEDEKDEEMEEYKKYLEEKYDETFVLGEATYDRSRKHYVFDAHPENREEVRFVVYHDDNDEFHDTYISKKWEVEAKEEFDPFINDLYDDIWLYDLEIIFNTRTSDVIMDENDEIPSFEEGAKKYGDLYHYGVMIYVFEDMSDDNKQEELERMYEVIQFFEENEIHVGSYEVEYYDEAFQSEIGEDTMPDVVEHGEYATFFLSVSQEKIEQVDSPSDLEQYVVDLRE